MLINELLTLLIDNPTVQRRFLKISYMYGLGFVPVPDDLISLLTRIR